MGYIISYDLGTGGTKASLYNEDGISLGYSFLPCKTYYPSEGFHEQRPDDWFISVVDSTGMLLEKTGVSGGDVLCLALSGHSLGVVPVDDKGSLLAEYTPIWSDGRAQKQAAEFFRSVDEGEWYDITGNGFPSPLYSIFKIMWYKDNARELFDRAYKFIGSKDYINSRLTGVICTDHSYASGSGVYDLTKGAYREEFIAASGIPAGKLPDILPSSKIIGSLTNDAAKLLGLPSSVKVACGGVDNSCMSLGARCFKDGQCYASLGSSAAIVVSSGAPLVNREKKTYIFSHCVEGQFVSSTSIFSAGTAFTWVRDQICQNIVDAAERKSENPYAMMDEMIKTSPAGANKLLFIPSLAGGCGASKSPKETGAYVGLTLRHSQADMIRAAMEGISMYLRLALDALKGLTGLPDEILLVGGGARSDVWCQILADAYNVNIVKSVISQDAGSLGAAALAAVGTGIWSSYDPILKLHSASEIIRPRKRAAEYYENILPVYKAAADMQSDIGDLLSGIKDFDQSFTGDADRQKQ